MGEGGKGVGCVPMVIFGILALIHAGINPLRLHCDWNWSVTAAIFSIGLILGVFVEDEVRGMDGWVLKAFYIVFSLFLILAPWLSRLTKTPFC